MKQQKVKSCLHLKWPGKGLHSHVTKVRLIRRGWEGVSSPETFSHDWNLNSVDTYLNEEKKNNSLHVKPFWHARRLTRENPRAFCFPLNQYLTGIERNPFGRSFNDLTSQIINCHVSAFRRACLALTLICKANQRKRQGFLDVWPTEQPKLLFSGLLFSFTPTFAWTSTLKLSNFPCRVKAALKKCSQEKERRTRQKEADKAWAFWPPGVSGCEWRVTLVLWHANEALILTNALSLPSGNRATGLIIITTGCCRGRRDAGPFTGETTSAFTVSLRWRAEQRRVREVAFVRVGMKFLWSLWRWGGLV